MRRSTLSTKLFAAALPIVLAVAALLALTVRNDLREVQQAENGAELGRVWEPLINALGAIENELTDAQSALDTIDEREAAIDAADGVMGNLGAPGAADAERDAAARYDAANPRMTTADLAIPRAASDAALDQLVAAIERIDGAESATAYVTEARSSLLSGRRIVDRAILAPDMLADEADPVGSFERASRDLVAIGEVLPSEAGDPELGTGLLAVLKLARARLAAGDVIVNVDTWQADPLDSAALTAARISFSELENHLSEFEAIAPEEWLLQYRNSGFPSQIAGFRSDLNQAAVAVDRGEIASFDDAAFQELVRQGVGFQTLTAQSIVEQAETQVDSVRNSSFRRILITLAAVLLAALLAWFINRSITRRIKAVARGANQVASEQLPALVEALQDPRGRAILPDIDPVSIKGSDEVAELARSFNSMQATLVDVAQEQVEVLRRGVSDIFVTMARRNRSLIDRQLAMLDEYEAEVEDPEILANYYQLDHLATRMRRNSESLLVLANAEPKRKRVKATEIDDVVRASIGEVEDYRRVEIETLESLQVRGNVVADISHLLAELLDNATSFSPPDSVVRVGGRRTGDSYMLRIVDDGVGIGTERMRELNELLREPPIVGLSVESTLGMSVVSLLANKHGIKVTLAAGNPGLTVDVLLPSTVFGPIDTPEAMPAPAQAPVAAVTPTVADEAIVDWEAGTNFTDDEMFVPHDEQPAVPATEPVVRDRFDDDAPRVATADWTKMSLDLSAFKSGMASASAEPEVPAETPRPDGSDIAEPAADPVAGAPVETAPEPATAHDAIEPLRIEMPAIDVPTPDVIETPTVETPVVETPVVEEAAVETPVVEAPAVEAPAVETPVVPSLGAPSIEELAAVVADHEEQAPAEAPVARRGEFDRPLAPPITAAPLSQRPVAPADALGAPAPAPAPTAPGLPTRSPGSGRPDGGPDRLADAEFAPSALEAALGSAGLPTREPTNGNGAAPVDDRSSSTGSRLDPDALRERLRAFQSEFRSVSEPELDHTSHNSTSNSNGDLGGDRS